MAKYCTVDGCDQPVSARGWCKAHYARWSRNGDPLGGRTTTTAKGEALAHFRFWVGEWTEDCMIWPYELMDGYGRLTINGQHKRVHVLACEHHHGPKPSPAMQAAHGACHTRACWNGQHVSWKTQSQNSIDKVRDGTDSRGENHHNVVLTESDVLIIRREVAAGVKQMHFARLYRVSSHTISDIVARRKWKHV